MFPVQAFKSRLVSGVGELIESIGSNLTAGVLVCFCRCPTGCCYMATEDGSVKGCMQNPWRFRQEKLPPSEPIPITSSTWF